MDFKTLIDTIKSAIAHDNEIGVWSEINYGRIHKTYVNIDSRNPPGIDDCPYVVFYPTAKIVGPGTFKKRHNIDVVCCIHDDQAETNAENNIIEYKGVGRIWEFRKLVETALSGMDVGRLVIDLVEAEYDTIESFPFMLVSMSMEIGQEHLIGTSALS